jgi:hypothetical protein
MTRSKAAQRWFETLGPEPVFIERRVSGGAKSPRDRFWYIGGCFGSNERLRDAAPLDGKYRGRGVVYRVRQHEESDAACPTRSTMSGCVIRGRNRWQVRLLRWIGWL